MNAETYELLKQGVENALRGFDRAWKDGDYPSAEEYAKIMQGRATILLQMTSDRRQNKFTI